MQIYSLSGTENVPKLTAELPGSSVMVLGFFDGVHLGHAALIAAAREYAEKVGAPLCVWTFSSVPKAARVITTRDEKLDIFSSLGVDCTVLEDFSAVRDLEHDVFFDEIIVKQFSPRALFCGFNFRYGRGAAGDAKTLVSSAEKAGIRAFVLPPYEVGGSPLSSSRIRELISEGAVDEAASLLGRPLSYTSPVLHGKRIGGRIGYPTINQRLGGGKITPLFGVYCASVSLDGRQYRGVCNIGCRPTVNDDESDITLETHVFGYDGDAYGKEATVSLLTLLRREKRFSSTDELSSQIASDCAAALSYFENNHN